VEHARELVVPSHFDTSASHPLCTARHARSAYAAKIRGNGHGANPALLEITQGRAFCLFTSYAQMNEIHDAAR